jgi:hypothetical protein
MGARSHTKHSAFQELKLGMDSRLINPSAFGYQLRSFATQNFQADDPLTTMSKHPSPSQTRPVSRKHMKHIPLIPGSAALALLSCSCSDIVFATRTSLGVEVAGDATPVPDHVNFGFRRREHIYVGKDAPKTGSLLGKLDSETTWTRGVAIRETFATGTAAANIANGEEPGEGHTSPDGIRQPVTFASRTRIGLALSAGGSDDDSQPSFSFGYSRRIATRIKTNGNPNLPSIVGDVTVHTGGMVDPAGADGASGPGAILPEEHRLSGTANRGQARVRQLFAIGEGTAAINAAKAREIKEVIETQTPQQP